MSLYSRDPILLTPGPLTTSLATKAAMLRDWGSWDAQFNAVTADVRQRLIDVIHAADTHVCVPLQGSGSAWLWHRFAILYFAVKGSRTPITSLAARRS